MNNDHRNSLRGTSGEALYIHYLISSLLHTYEVGNLINSSFHMGRGTERLFAENHTASKWQSQNTKAVRQVQSTCFSPVLGVGWD